MNATDRAIEHVTGAQEVVEVGGSIRRHEGRLDRFGSDTLIPYLRFYAWQLLRHGSGAHTSYERIAREAMENIQRYGLNHDKYAQFTDTQWQELPAVLSTLIEELLDINAITYEKDSVGPSGVVYRVGEGADQLMAPWSIEALVLPREKGKPIPRAIRIHPYNPTSRYELSVARIHPPGNPQHSIIEIKGERVDPAGDTVDKHPVVLINRIPDDETDHRWGQVNARQAAQMRVFVGGWYSVHRQNLYGPFDGISETFPHDPNRAYSVALRMAAEAIEKVYDQRDEEWELADVRRIAREVAPSVQRLVEIVLSGTVSKHKVTEGFQQIIKFVSLQPRAWAVFATETGLARLFPRAIPLLERLSQEQLHAGGDVWIDFSLTRDARYPDLLLSGKHYRLSEPATLSRFLRYAEEVGGVMFPLGLSPLGKLAWLFEPSIS